MNTIKINSKATKVIAHRGMSGIERENTAAAFVAAGNRGYFGIETDVHKTSDGKYIIIHDDTTGRIADINLSVEGSDFNTLRNIRLADRTGKPREDLCMPSLEEYLRICATYEKTAVLELKNPFLKDDIKNILEIVKREYSIEKMIFISFEYQNLVYLRKLSSSASLQFLCACDVNKELIEKLKLHDLDLDIEHSHLDENAVIYLHKNGIKINCWTVDDSARAEKLAKWNVDYITTNILEGKTVEAN